MARVHIVANTGLRRSASYALGALLLLLAGLPSALAGPSITGFEWHAEKNQAIFPVSGEFQYRVFTLSDPARVVVDFLDARPADQVEFSIDPNPLIRGIRAAGRFDGNGERVVFDLYHAAKPRSFKRHDASGKLLVIDFGAQAASREHTKPVATAASSRPQRLRDVVIAIDAGHGGHDPGAIGPDGLEEKDVTLAIAKDLYRYLSHIKGIKPVLTRKGDYFVTLAGRRKIAREANADLFVSIHADSSTYNYPKGSSVYVLSLNGASSVAARILAQRENAVDEIGGVELADEEPVVRSAIVKLAQRGSIAQGLQLARSVMAQITQVVPLHSETVERAPFAVLKSPDIPSILVETAFISNPQQENKLATPAFRKRIAKAVAQGIEAHVRQFAPPGTLIAARRNAIYALKKG
ncbi:MAG: N-acetylmuramoyl-L-alanine amidase [Gammaproteobacteria bacterium]|nr:N-acetylmuramoyl-L-alanine amidase [Gammaproteobacteria bacterium]